MAIAETGLGPVFLCLLDPAAFASWCGLLFRVRGGLIGLDGTTALSRAAWALGVPLGLLLIKALCGALDGATLRAAAVAVPLLFIGAVGGWPSSIDLGRNEGAWRDDFLGQVERGLQFTLPAGLGLVVAGNGDAVWLGLAGVLAGPLYEIAWRIPSRVPGLRQGGELGEVFFGAAIGAVLFIVTRGVPWGLSIG